MINHIFCNNKGQLTRVSTHCACGIDAKWFSLFEGRCQAAANDFLTHSFGPNRANNMAATDDRSWIQIMAPQRSASPSPVATDCQRMRSSAWLVEQRFCSAASFECWIARGILHHHPCSDSSADQILVRLSIDPNLPCPVHSHSWYVLHLSFVVCSSSVRLINLFLCFLSWYVRLSSSLAFLLALSFPLHLCTRNLRPHFALWLVFVRLEPVDRPIIFSLFRPPVLAQRVYHHFETLRFDSHLHSCFHFIVC